MDEARFNVKRWWPAIVLAVFLLLVGGGYIAGYRVAPGLMIERLVSLTISDLPSGTSVYVDNRSRASAVEGALTLKLLPGDHSILISAEGYWPWRTLLPISEPSESVSAFLVPLDPGITILKNGEAGQINAALEAYVLPSEAEPLRLGCSEIYVSSNRIIASAPGNGSCAPPPFLCVEGSCEATIVFTPVEKISSVVPYPSREDALIVSAGSHVYALALDPRDPRTFAPLLISKSPMLVTLPDGTLGGRDGQTVFSLSFAKHEAD